MFAVTANVNGDANEHDGIGHEGERVKGDEEESRRTADVGIDPRV
jgi:hypothetical protein